MKSTFIVLFSLLFISCKQSNEKVLQIEDKEERWFFWSADWHPTQDLVVFGGSNDSYLKLISTKDFKEVQSIPYKGTITKTKWHPKTNLLAIAVQDGKSKLSILNIDTNQKINLDSITNDGARAIGWNKSGDLLAVGDNEGFLTFFNEDGEFIKTIDTEQKGLMDLDWHPTENIVLTVGEKITWYNYDTENLKHIEDRNEDMLMLSVVWHPNGSMFVTGDYGDFINNYSPLLQYWSYEGNNLKSITDSKAEFRNLQWSSDGKFLASASEKLRIWNEKGELVSEEFSQNLLWGIDWNTNDNQLVTTDDQGKIIFWSSSLEVIKEIAY